MAPDGQPVTAPLTVPELQAALDRVTYRPGWTFTAYEHPFEGPHLLIVAPVPNAYRPEETVDLGIRSPLPPMWTEHGLIVWLAWRLGRVESHEMREWLRVDGRAPFDPHAEAAA